MERYQDSQTWLVVFDKSYGGFKWWHIFLHPKFRHIHLVTDNRGQALTFSALAHVIAVKEYPLSLVSYVQQEMSQTPTAILQYTVHYSSHYRNAPIEPLTCVSLAKRILGIRRRLFTPKSLYHELIKAGALVIKPYTIT